MKRDGRWSFAISAFVLLLTAAYVFPRLHITSDVSLLLPAGSDREVLAVWSQVADSELALSVLGRSAVTAGAGVDGLRIGHVRQFYDGDKLADPDVVAAIDAAVAVLGELGARVEEVEVDPLDRFEQCGLLILSVESHTLYGHAVATTPELFGPRASQAIQRPTRA